MFLRNCQVEKMEKIYMWINKHLFESLKTNLVNGTKSSTEILAKWQCPVLRSHDIFMLRLLYVKIFYVVTRNVTYTMFHN